MQVGKSAAQKWKVGQRVGMLCFKHACRTCDGCRNYEEVPGKPDIRACANKEMAGFTHDGAIAEYIVGDAEQAVLLPDNVPFEQGAPLMCAGVSQAS